MVGPTSCFLPKVDRGREFGKVLLVAVCLGRIMNNMPLMFVNPVPSRARPFAVCCVLLSLYLLQSVRERQDEIPLPLLLLLRSRRRRRGQSGRRCRKQVYLAFLAAKGGRGPPGDICTREGFLNGPMFYTERRRRRRKQKLQQRLCVLSRSLSYRAWPRLIPNPLRQRFSAPITYLTNHRRRRRARWGRPCLR